MSTHQRFGEADWNNATETEPCTVVNRAREDLILNTISKTVWAIKDVSTITMLLTICSKCGSDRPTEMLVVGSV